MAVSSSSFQKLPLPGEAVQDALAAYYGLPQYVWLLDFAKQSQADIARSENFQRSFNSLYRVRRSEGWRRSFYALFQQAKENSSADFAQILRRLFDETGFVETSFVSKMLATLNPSLPIWDSRVVKTFNASGRVCLEVPSSCSSHEKRFAAAISSYQKLGELYRSFLDSGRAKDYLSLFNSILPRFASISDMKKIDCLLWGAQLRDKADKKKTVSA